MTINLSQRTKEGRNHDGAADNKEPPRPAPVFVACAVPGPAAKPEDTAASESLPFPSSQPGGDRDGAVRIVRRC